MRDLLMYEFIYLMRDRSIPWISLYLEDVHACQITSSFNKKVGHFIK